MNSRNCRLDNLRHWGRAGLPATCDVFHPQTPSPLGHAVLWLHDEADATASTRASRLDALWEQHGLTVIAPDGGRFWWLDRVVPAFSQFRARSRFRPTSSCLGWNNA